MSEPYYQDDLVSLFLGDYREHLEELVDSDVAAVITDPPYGETSLAWDRWPSNWPADAAAVSSALWCFGSFRMFMDNLSDFGLWKFSQEIVWEKHNGSGFASDRFKRVHELTTLWYRGEWADAHHVVPTTDDATARTIRRKGRPTHMGSIDASSYASQDGGPRLMRSVLKIRSEHGRAVHPTQKPLGIVAPLIEYSVPRGGLVADFFAGSGTTLLAARNSGRRAIGFEVNEQYAEAAALRLSQQTFDLEAIV